MKYKPFRPQIADTLLHAIAENMFSPRGACGEVGIPYGELLMWLENNEDFAYKFERALTQRVAKLELEYLEAKDGHILKILLPILKVCNPEAFDDGKGSASPVKQKATATAPFPRAWQDTPEPSEGAPARSQALPGGSPRVVKLKTVQE